MLFQTMQHTMRKRLTVLLVAGLLASVLSGCADRKENAAPMRTIKDAKGETTIPADPQRIADISGSAEELLLLERKLVAAANTDGVNPDRFPAYLQDRLEGAKLVGNYASGQVDLEALAASEPDLIVASAMFEKVYDQLRKIAPVFVISDNPYAFSGWRDRLKEIGAMLGEEAKADSWLKSYDEKTTRIGDRIKAKFGDESFAVLVAFPNNYSLFGNTGVGDMLFNDLKLRRDEGTPADDWGKTISLESVAEIKADNMFLLHSGEAGAELEKLDVWRTLNAVKNGKVFKLDNDKYYAMSFTPIGKELLLDTLDQTLLGD